MQIFDLTCLSLTSITFERIELQSSDWTQKSRFFKLYPNMLSVHFDFILICSFSGEKLKSVFFFDLSCIYPHSTSPLYNPKITTESDPLSTNPESVTNHITALPPHEMSVMDYVRKKNAALKGPGATVNIISFKH